jgi:hypothetical protein
MFGTHRRDLVSRARPGTHVAQAEDGGDFSGGLSAVAGQRRQPFDAGPVGGAACGVRRSDAVAQQYGAGRQSAQERAVVDGPEPERAGVGPAEAADRAPVVVGEFRARKAAGLSTSVGLVRQECPASSQVLQGTAPADDHAEA